MSDEYTDQVRVEKTVSKIEDELDALLVLAADPATARYSEAIAIGRIVRKTQLVANLIEARKSPKLKLVGA